MICIFDRRYKERERIKEERMLRWKLDMERKRIDRILRAEEKERSRLDVLESIKRKEEEVRARKVHIIEAKEKAAMFRMYHDCGLAQAKKEQKVS